MRILAALGLVCLSALPVTAQQLNANDVRPGETWLEFAKRMDACKGQEVLGAELVLVGGSEYKLDITCSTGIVAGGTNGMTGGLAGAAPIAGVMILVAGLAASGGSDGPTTTTGTGN